jgi:hypothetical protein
MYGFASPVYSWPHNLETTIDKGTRTQHYMQVKSIKEESIYIEAVARSCGWSRTCIEVSGLHLLPRQDYKATT